MTTEMTRAISLTHEEARQLFHGMEFAVSDFRKCRDAGYLTGILSAEAIEKTEAQMIALRDRMEKFAISIPND